MSATDIYFTNDGDRKECLEAGMDEYISKSVQVKELVEILKKYLGL